MINLNPTTNLTTNPNLSSVPQTNQQSSAGLTQPTNNLSTFQAEQFQLAFAHLTSLCQVNLIQNKLLLRSLLVECAQKIYANLAQQQINSQQGEYIGFEAYLSELQPLFAPQAWLEFKPVLEDYLTCCTNLAYSALYFTSPQVSMDIETALPPDYLPQLKFKAINYTQADDLGLAAAVTVVKQQLITARADKNYYLELAKQFIIGSDLPPVELLAVALGEITSPVYNKHDLMALAAFQFLAETDTVRTSNQFSPGLIKVLWLIYLKFNQALPVHVQSYALQLSAWLKYLAERQPTWAESLAIWQQRLNLKELKSIKLIEGKFKLGSTSNDYGGVSYDPQLTLSPDQRPSLPRQRILVLGQASEDTSDMDELTYNILKICNSHYDLESYSEEFKQEDTTLIIDFDLNWITSALKIKNYNQLQVSQDGVLSYRDHLFELKLFQLIVILPNFNLDSSLIKGFKKLQPQQLLFLVKPGSGLDIALKVQFGLKANYFSPKDLAGVSRCFERQLMTTEYKFAGLTQKVLRQRAWEIAHGVNGDSLQQQLFLKYLLNTNPMDSFCLEQLNQAIEFGCIHESNCIALLLQALAEDRIKDLSLVASITAALARRRQPGVIQRQLCSLLTANLPVSHMLSQIAAPLLVQALTHAHIQEPEALANIALALQQQPEWPNYFSLELLLKLAHYAPLGKVVLNYLTATNLQQQFKLGREDALKLPALLYDNLITDQPHEIVQISRELAQTKHPKLLLSFVAAHALFLDQYSDAGAAIQVWELVAQVGSLGLNRINKLFPEGFEWNKYPVLIAANWQTGIILTDENADLRIRLQTLLPFTADQLRYFSATVTSGCIKDTEFLNQLSNYPLWFQPLMRGGSSFGQQLSSILTKLISRVVPTPLTEDLTIDLQLGIRRLCAGSKPHFSPKLREYWLQLNEKLEIEANAKFVEQYKLSDDPNSPLNQLLDEIRQGICGNNVPQILTVAVIIGYCAGMSGLGTLNNSINFFRLVCGQLLIGLERSGKLQPLTSSGVFTGPHSMQTKIAASGECIEEELDRICGSLAEDRKIDALITQTLNAGLN